MKKEKQPDTQLPHYLYDRCSKAWWPALDAQKKILHFKKGALIFKEGEPVLGVYFMISGVVKVHKQWTADKELIIRFASGEDIVGHRGLSTQSGVYPISATALSKTELCFLDMDFFHASLKVNPDLMFDLLMFFADELQLSEMRMRDLAHMPVKNRVINTLIILEKKFGINEKGYIAFPVSRQDLAAYTGAAYETVYKLLIEFEQTGIIKTNGKEIGILDKKPLAR